MRFVYIVIILVPLPFASMDPLWRWFFGGGTCIAFCWVAWRHGLIRFSSNLQYILGAMFCLLVSAQLYLGLTINWHQTLDTSLYVVLQLLWLFVVANVVNQGESVKNASRVLQVITISGSLYCVYGLIVFFYYENAYVLGYEKYAYFRSLTSTFVNRNHFAAYCGLILLACFALVVLEIHKIAGGANKTGGLLGRLARVPDKALSRVLFYCVCGIVVFSALLLSGSRAGTLTAMSGVACFVFAISLLHNFRLATAFKGVKFFLVAMFVASILLSGFTEELFLRFQEDILADSRWQLYPILVTRIVENPIIGIGFGTFADFFGSMQEVGLDKPLLYAHNDLLELALGVGLPGTAAFLGFVALFYRPDWGRRNYPEKVLYIVSLTGFLQVGVHSLVDFPFQVPAVYYVLICLLGLSIRPFRVYDDF